VGFPGFNITHEYTDALFDSEVDCIYVATPIATHYMLVKNAIQSGKNVICEKPLVVSLKQVLHLYSLADEKKVKLHQVLMYQHHKQYQKLKSFIARTDFGKLKRVYISFKIPHLNLSDIRYSSDMCGGALYDVGFYPISLAISLFPMASFVSSVLTTEDGYDVDLAGSAIMKCNDIIIDLSWAIGSCYENLITLDYSQNRVLFERIFSKPETLDVNAKIFDNFGGWEIENIGEDDQFANMFINLLGDEVSPSSTDVDRLVSVKTIEILEMIKSKNKQ